MLQFILNKKEISTDHLPGITMLDFIRYHKHLTGTKIGCREGDCGACTVLVGEIINDKLVYSSATSCLMPIANAKGKHIVTIEGLNGDGMNAVQQAFADEGATQCGFCTPGFIVSLAGFCVNETEPSFSGAIDAVNGNICRCTGYKSIERAAAAINRIMQQRNGIDALQFAADNNMVPAFFLGIKDRLLNIRGSKAGTAAVRKEAKILAGGTDIYVQQHDTIAGEDIEFLYDISLLKGITKEGNTCKMGASVTVSDIAGSPVFQAHFPGLKSYIKLVSSTQIRNMATVAGNFTNASPIGDLTIFFLALKASVILNNGNAQRQLKLADFYKGYKTLDKLHGEYMEKILFELPGENDLFNFEKVCKRTHLDIASVNAAIHLKMKDDVIIDAGLSAGGVGPVPLFLQKCSSFLAGKKVSASLISELVSLAQEEIKPISDTRGTETYKRLLLSQLIKAHFIKLFPVLKPAEVIHA